MKRLYILEEWNSFARAVLTPDCPSIQREEMRKAFYAGAQSLFATLMNLLEPGAEPTAGDLLNMDAIHEELMDFVKQVRAEASR